MLRDATTQIGRMLHEEPGDGLPPALAKLLALGAGFPFDPPPSPARRPGIKGHRERHYAEWAARYAEASRVSRAPNRDLEARYGFRSSWIRDTVHEARRRGLLTEPPGPGIAGGALTPRALEILGAEPAMREGAGPDAADRERS
jgi:hypothetical protein